MLTFFIALSLLIGLYFFRWNIVLSIICCLLFVAFIIYRFKSRKIVLFVSIFALFCGIGMSACIRFIPMSNNTEYTGLVVETKENHFIFKTGFEKFYVYEKENNRETGDCLKIYGKTSSLDFTTYESQFDFNQYLKDKGVKGTLNASKIEVKWNCFLRLKPVKNKFLSKFDNDTRALVDSLLFNKKDYSNDTIKIASEMGLLVLVSTSGIYLHFAVKIIEYVLNLKFSERISKLLAFIFIAPYAIFAFPKIGVIRVCLTSIFALVNLFFLKSKYKSLTITSFVAILMLLFDHNLAYQSAFLIGISLPILINFLNTSLRYKKKKIRRIFIPIFIYLFLFPMMTVENGSFHVLTFLIQTILLPINQVFSFIVILCFYGLPIHVVLQGYSWFLRTILGFVSYADATIPFAGLSEIYIVIYYAILMFSLYLFEGKRNTHFKYSIYGLISTICFGFLPLHPLFRNAVFFVNVGQGDCIIIQNKKHAVMIDTGGNISFDMATETLIPFLNKKQIFKIDALITSHDDFDHAGAKDSLCENFPVERYLKNRSDFPYRINDIFIENLSYFNGKDENQNSLVLKLDFIGKKFLFMGDADENTEKWLIDNKKDIDCDILKVGHHGALTSTSESFLKASTPDEAVISVGASNMYHHPSYKIIERLKKFNIKIRRTDYEGTISYVSYFS